MAFHAPFSGAIGSHFRRGSARFKLPVLGTRRVWTATLLVMTGSIHGMGPGVALRTAQLFCICSVAKSSYTEMADFSCQRCRCCRSYWAFAHRSQNDARMPNRQICQFILYFQLYLPCFTKRKVCLVHPQIGHHLPVILTSPDPTTFSFQTGELGAFAPLERAPF